MGPVGRQRMGRRSATPRRARRCRARARGCPGRVRRAGDLLRITDAAGRLVLQFDVEPLSDNPNESYTRNPDVTGDFEQRGTTTPRLFSPGRQLDGSAF